MSSETVFIGGLHGSGTSLLHRWLRAHPKVSGIEGSGVPEDEGQHLQDVLPTAKSLGGMGRFGFATGGHLTERSSLASAATRDALEASWGRYWNRHSAVRVEKSPPNLIRFRLLQSLFPGSVAVALIRHPLAVAYSCQQKRRLNRLRSLRGFVEHWLHCHRLFAADRPKTSRLVVVRYEELVGNPSAALAPLWSELGLSPVEGPEPVRSDRDAEHAKAWRRRLLRPPLPATLLALEAEVSSWGYSLRDFGSDGR